MRKIWATVNKTWIAGKMKLVIFFISVKYMSPMDITTFGKLKNTKFDSILLKWDENVLTFYNLSPINPATKEANKAKT